jgi:membrane protease YdiL (CAAX protease family)
VPINAAFSFSAEQTKPVAPWWHTILLSAFFLILAMAGLIFQSNASSQNGALFRHPNMVPLYITLIAFQCGLLYYVWKIGLRRRGAALRELIGGRWSGAKDVLIDLGLAVGLWLVWMIFLSLWTRLLGSGHAVSIRSLMPQQPAEVALWVLLSISAGFCEEVVFRGYFLRQFAALTHSTWIALLMQALLFGISHGYQGLDSTVKITIYGGLFGLMAVWRRSLRPGIAAHALTDILAIL